MSHDTPIKVILVEDEVLVAMDLEQEFASMGMDVVGTAGTLEEAERLAEQADYDVAIFDIDLQGEDVFPAAQIAHRRGRHFVFFSGVGESGRLHKSFPDAPLVKKPATAAQLFDAFKAVA